MGTHCNIGVQNADGTVLSIYCHYDGYLSHAGKRLLKNYSDETKLRELISLGNVVNIAEGIGEKHGFHERPDGQMTFYGRDGGYDDQEPTVSRDVNDWLVSQGQEFNYLFCHGRWFIFLGDVKAAVDLEDAIAKEEGRPASLSGFDPIEDEKKEFLLHDWVETLKFELDGYEMEHGFSPNEFHRQKHTFAEWTQAFMRYMSW